MRILIIEDDPGVSRFIKRGLESERYDVDIALEGEEGLRLARTSDYGIIILDIYMPGKTGLELCEIIRKEKIATPILVMTAQDSSETVEKGYRAGANDYLSKPFPFDLLLAKVEALDVTREPVFFPEEL